MPNIDAIFEAALRDAERILSLLSAIDGRRCMRTHKRMAALLNRSDTHWAEQVWLLTMLLASIIEQVAPEQREMLAADMPVLIDLARERVEDALRGGGTNASGGAR